MSCAHPCCRYNVRQRTSVYKNRFFSKQVATNLDKESAFEQNSKFLQFYFSNIKEYWTTVVVVKWSACLLRLLRRSEFESEFTVIHCTINYSKIWVSKCKKSSHHRSVDSIASSSSPGFESQARHLCCFSHFNCYAMSLNCENKKLKYKERGCGFKITKD